MTTDQSASPSERLLDIGESLENSDGVSVATAFELLGEETRLRIIDALYTANRADSEEAVRFSQLREAVGVQDTGQFNYHLNRLLGTFVIRTDDGYVLSSAGEAVGRLLAAHSVEGSVSAVPSP